MQDGISWSWFSLKGVKMASAGSRQPHGVGFSEFGDWAFICNSCPYIHSIVRSEFRDEHFRGTGHLRVPCSSYGSVCNEL